MTRRLVILSTILVFLTSALAYTTREHVSRAWISARAKPPAPSFNPFPPPLRHTTAEPADTLSVAKVLSVVNKHRTANDLAPLASHSVLNRAAYFKLGDMLELQYLDHASPSGQETSDIVDSLNFNYSLIGVNLAVGTFSSEEELVETWLRRTGTRDNLLHPSYTNIGLAIRQDMFQGRQSWLAVQILARRQTSPQ